MSDARIVRLTDELDWQPFEIPDSSEPVAMFPLRYETDTRARTLFVRFPAGWKRPVTGYYESGEDVLFISGELEMGGTTYRPGDYGYIPGGRARAGSYARTEVLALARFEGPARWSRGPDTSEEPLVHRQVVPHNQPSPSPLGAGTAWRLHESSWLVHAPKPGTLSLVDAELFSIDEMTWAWVPKGEAFPALDGACFCRTF